MACGMGSVEVYRLLRKSEPRHMKESRSRGNWPHPSSILSENVGGVGFTTDVGDCNGTFVDPFTCNVLL